MKLIIAIIHDGDTENVTQALVNASFRVTRVASTGGFLRRGMTTLMVGTDPDQVDRGIEVIRDSTSPPPEPGMRRATLFVIPVENFTQL